MTTTTKMARDLAQNTRKMMELERKQAGTIAGRVVAAVDRAVARQVKQGDGYWWVQVVGVKSLFVGDGRGNDDRRDALITGQVRGQLEAKGYDVRSVERSGPNTFVRLAANEEVRDDGADAAVVVHW